MLKLPDAEYRAIKDRVSISELNHIAIAPAVFKKNVFERVDKKKPKALRLGTIWHTVLLEPENIKDFVISSSSDERTAIFKDAEKEAKERGTIVASEEELANARNAAAILLEHPKVKELLKGAIIEHAIFWESEGVQCKGKFDAVNRGALIDFKTTESATGFARSVMDYNYHRQMAFYMDGLNACGVNVDTAYWIVCEKDDPFLHKVYQCDKESIQVGRQEYKRMLRLYKECKASDKWPGLSQDVEIIGLPKWHIENQTIETNLIRRVV